MPGSRRLPAGLPTGLVRLLVAGLFLAGTAAAQNVTLDFATEAPESSLTTKSLRAAAAEIAERSKGRIRLLVFAGGQRGDEKAVVGQMKSGELHGAAFAGPGLAEIAKEVLVLQVPGLVSDYQILDLVRSKLSKRFEKNFLEQGFVLLGLGDSGYSYLFSRTPIRTPADLKGGKPWVASSDAIISSLYRLAGVTATPLPVAELLQNLTNGGVQTFTATPMTAIVLSWFELARYLTNLKLGVSLHGVVVAKAAWDQLTEDDRKLVGEVISRWHDVYVEKVRAESTDAVKALKGRGLEVIAPEDAAWNALLERVQDDLAGKLYPRELLDTVRKLVKDAR
jgi:TRAP-type C4-dicarboxylate transport system substrate-binding protein